MVGQYFRSLRNDLTGEICVRFLGLNIYKRQNFQRSGKLYDFRRIFFILIRNGCMPTPCRHIFLIGLTL